MGQLEHCLRLYPHLVDSGGFFVAVLRKEKREDVSGDDTTWPDWAEGM